MAFLPFYFIAVVLMMCTPYSNSFASYRSASFCCAKVLDSMMKMSLSLFVEFGPGLSPQFHRFPLAKLLLVSFGDIKSANPACIRASDLEQVLNGASRFLANAWVVKQFTTPVVA